MKKGKQMDADLRHELARVAAELGDRQLAAELGLNNATVARALSGFEVYGGTVAAIRAFLERRRAEKRPAA